MAVYEMTEDGELVEPSYRIVIVASDGAETELRCCAQGGDSEEPADDE